MSGVFAEHQSRQKIGNLWYRNWVSFFSKEEEFYKRNTENSHLNCKNHYKLQFLKRPLFSANKTCLLWEDSLGWFSCFKNMKCPTSPRKDPISHELQIQTGRRQSHPEETGHCSDVSDWLKNIPSLTVMISSAKFSNWCETSSPWDLP